MIKEAYDSGAAYALQKLANESQQHQTKHAELTKEAIIGAGLIHMLQNIYMNSAMKRKGFGQELGDKFISGVKGDKVSRLKSFMEGLHGGAIVPEKSIMKQQSLSAGHDLNRSLREKGIDSLTRRDAVIGRLLSRGDFESVAKYIRGKSTPAIDTMMASITSKTSVPVKELISSYSDALMSGNSEKLLSIQNKLKAVKQVWNDPKQSPFSANILSNIFTGSKKKGDMNLKPITNQGDIDSKYRLAGNSVGSGAVGIIDPITGGMNMSKNLLTNPVTVKPLRKTGLGSKVLDYSENELLKNPVSTAFTKGMQNEPQSLSQKVMSHVRNIGQNSVVEQTSRSARNLGAAVANPVKPKFGGTK